MKKLTLDIFIVDKRKFFAEFIGTCILSLIVLISDTPATPFPVSTPVAAAITLSLCVYLLGDISGCFINPSMSFTAFITKKIDFKTFCYYLIAELLGAVLAYFISIAYVPANQEQWLTVKQATLFDGVGEMLGSIIFAFGIFSMINNKTDKILSGLIVGMSLLVGIIVAHNASYGVLNPAVAIANKAWSFYYIIMPIIGAVIGGLISSLLFKNK
ncbi:MULTISPECIES: aquaporin [unclassified Francisella]|uniref:aquaporin n=1 Tax=unclassified Francisella TaxID=2610885 RepID=UPI002E32523A|nr:MULTISPECIES: aquaporin [unclassified Francisella]MED7819769.1 aquaporin [Francisella sp. 19S2-4]MED7830589.1 aquaporin [Francisella sp. 19S2-10]